MKKVLSSVVAALVALSFAGIVCAAEPAPAAMPAGHPPVAAPAAGDVKKEEAKPAKKKKAGSGG
jgi:predicted small lipoprotein YifL